MGCCRKEAKRDEASLMVQMFSRRQEMQAATKEERSARENVCIKGCKKKVGKVERSFFDVSSVA